MLLLYKISKQVRMVKGKRLAEVEPLMSESDVLTDLIIKGIQITATSSDKTQKDTEIPLRWFNLNTIPPPLFSQQLYCRGITTSTPVSSV